MSRETGGKYPQREDMFMVEVVLLEVDSEVGKATAR